jgi:hypothetical protein
MSRVRDIIQRGTRAAQPLATAVDVGVLYYVTDELVTERSNGTVWGTYSDGGASAGVVLNHISNGRLTTETGVPISTSDRTAQSTIFFTPYQGNKIALYDTADWNIVSFTELSLALSGLTTASNYDVFLDYNGGTPQLVLGTVWTNDTTRAVALTLVDGVYVLTGSEDHRYLGTIRTTSTTTTEDSLAKRFVWNAQNRTRRVMRGALETTDSWTYTIATWRQARASATNQLELLVGLNEDAVYATLIQISSQSGTSAGRSAGIGLDSTTTPSNVHIPFIRGTHIGTITAQYHGLVGVGYHFLAWLEISTATGTSTYYGDFALPTRVQSGISGVIFN